MLIVAIALAVIGLASLVAAVVTSNEILAWVCIAASASGVLLLVVDAIKDRQSRRAAGYLAAGQAGAATVVIAESETEVIAAPADADGAADEAAELAAEIAEEDHPEEVVHDEPEFDAPGDDEAEFPEAAEASAMHVVSEDALRAEEAADAADLRDVEVAGDAELDNRGGR